MGIIFKLSCLMFTFLSREFIVDLVGKPGNVYGPDSSISGSSLTSVPSPFQVSHLKGFQQDVKTQNDCQSLNSKYACCNNNPTCSGVLYFTCLCSVPFKFRTIRILAATFDRND